MLRSIEQTSGYNRVTVFWIPGHRGIKGNETADRIAKLATKKQTPSGLEPVIGISNRSVTEDIKTWLAEKHQEEWYKATEFFSFCHELSDNNFFFVFSQLQRQEDRILPSIQKWNF